VGGSVFVERLWSTTTMTCHGPDRASEPGLESCEGVNAVSSAPSPGLEAVAKGPHDRVVELVSEELVLVSRVDAGVVVDLDDIRLFVDLLEIHAVQPGSNEVGGAQRRLHDGLGDAVQRNRHRVTLTAVFARLVARDHLPVLAGHEVLAGIDRP